MQEYLPSYTCTETQAISLILLELLGQLFSPDIENIVFFWHIGIQQIANNSHCAIDLIDPIVTIFLTVSGQQLSKQCLVEFDAINVLEGEDDHVQLVRSDTKVIIAVGTHQYSHDIMDHAIFQVLLVQWRGIMQFLHVSKYEQQ